MTIHKSRVSSAKASFGVLSSMPKTILPEQELNAAHLAEAKKIILGQSEFFAFDEQGVLINRDAEKTTEWHLEASQFEKENFPESKPKNLDLGKVPLGALSTMLALIVDYATAMNMDGLQLTVSTQDKTRDPLHRLYLEGLQDQQHRPFDNPGNRMFRNPAKPFDKFSPEHQSEILDDQKLSEETSLKSIEYYLERIDILTGRKEEAPKENLEYISDEGDEDYVHAPDPAEHDPKFALQECLRLSAQVRFMALKVNRPESYLSQSNQYPDAVKFMQQSQGASFLYYPDGRKQSFMDVEKITYFVEQPWLQLAGNIELKVPRPLLDGLRAQLRAPISGNHPAP